MALEKIVINVSGQADLDSTIKKLTQLGLVDEKNAKSFQKNSKEAQSSIDTTKNKLGGLDKALTNIGPALAGAFAVGQVINLGKQILDITSKFQKFEAVLTNTLGSQSAAQKAMQMIVEFASKTPFAVDELTQSYVKLANQGFKPTADEMRKLGDLASSQGKSFDQLTEAIIDAQTGEFERLKEFGIRAKKEGDKVTFTFKEQETTVKATAGSIREYILGLGNAQGVSGSMAAISKTLEGQLSNLGDTFDQVLLSLGKSGSGGFSEVIGALNVALGELGNALQDKPSLFDSIKEAGIGLFRVYKDLYDATVGLVLNFFEVKRSGSEAKSIFDALGVAFKVFLVPLKVTIQGFITLVHSLDAVVKAGKNVYNFFKGNELEDLGLGRLKKDFSNFVDIITLSDGKFKHAAENIVENTNEVVKAQQKEVRSIKTLEDELKNLVKQRDETDISNKKELNSLNAQIKAKQDLIKELKGEGESRKALEAFKKMQEKPLAKDLNLELKGEEALSKEKIKLKKLEVQEFGDSEEKHTDKLLKEIEDRKKANQIYTDFVINSIMSVATAFQDSNNIKTENEINRLNTETDEQIKALEIRNKAGLLSDEELATAKDGIKKKQAQKELVLRRQQAQQEKNFSLFQIALNTAQAVMKTIAQFGPPIPPNFVSIAGVATTLATGALEAGIVASRPLPGFKKGGFTGQGNSNDTAGIVHKNEFVMPAEKTKQYRKELQEMYEGRFGVNHRDPIKLRKSLTDARNDNMAENILKSMMINGQFNDKNIVNAISKNNKIKLSNSGELANKIASKIADRTAERGLFS